MSTKLLVTILSPVLVTGLLAMTAQAHEGETGKHYAIDSSGNPVKSSSGCVISSGSGGKHFEACGDTVMAKTEMAPVLEVAAVPAPTPVIMAPAPVMMAPAPVMMKPAKPMGASHSHPANRCTNSIMHTHAGPGAHSHRYSCKANKMASPRQMAAPRQKASY